MNRHVFLFLLCAALVFTSCDVFRSMAGKPTSRDLEARRIELIAAAKAQMTVAPATDSADVADSMFVDEVVDSLDTVVTAEVDLEGATVDINGTTEAAVEAADSATVLSDVDPIVAPEGAVEQEVVPSAENRVVHESLNIKSLDNIKELYSDQLTCKYYVILGTYSSDANVDVMLKKASAAGFIPVKIIRENGYVSVGIESGNSMYEAKYDLKALRRESFCPRDAWILSNKAAK